MTNSAETSGTPNESGKSLPAGQRPTDFDAARPRLRRTLLLCGCGFLASSILTGMLAFRGGERFSGRLSAVKTEITAPIDGVILQTEVESGRVVIENQPLFILVDSQRMRQIEERTKEVQQLRHEIKKTKAQVELESDRLTAEIDETRFNVEQTMTSLLRERFRLQFEEAVVERAPTFMDTLLAAEANSSMFLPLSSSTGVPSFSTGLLKDVQEKASRENDLETMQARISLCEKRLEELSTERKQIALRVSAANGLDELQQQLNAAESGLQMLNGTQEAISINAPGYGTLSELNAQVDKSVRQGDVLVSLYDRDQETVSVDLPSRVAPYVQSGMRVSIFFPGDREGEGEIISIPTQVSDPSQKQDDPRMTVLIKAVGRVWPNLPIGSAVEVSLQSK